MKQEHFLSDGGLTPHFFFHIFHFLKKKVLPFVASFFNPLVFTRWRIFGCYSATWMNNNKNFIKQQHWTMNIFFSDGGLTPHFFHIHFLRRRSYPSSFHLSILWSSPGGKDLLVFTGGGRACPKITARCWEIVSVGQLLVRQFQWEMLGLTLTIFDRKIHDFLLCFSINLVVLCPWLCAINSVDPISSLDFYGPMLWLTAAGWIVSVGDVGLNAHNFWSKNPWFFTVFFPLIWWFFALGFVPSIQWTRSLL